MTVTQSMISFPFNLQLLVRYQMGQIVNTTYNIDCFAFCNIEDIKSYNAKRYNTTTFIMHLYMLSINLFLTVLSFYHFP